MQERASYSFYETLNVRLSFVSGAYEPVAVSR